MINNFKIIGIYKKYKGDKEKVCIICPEHGEFWQLPGSHLKGHGCVECRTDGNTKYTKEQCLEAALKCQSRVEFYKKYQPLSLAAQYRGWYEECCAHMGRRGNKQRLIYAYEFDAHHAAYIGLTFSMDVSQLKDVFLENSQWIHREGNIIFSHAGVSKVWMEINDLKHVDQINELPPSEVFGFTPCHFSDFTGTSETQPPTWIRPQSLIFSGIDNYIQIVKDNIINVIRNSSNVELEKFSILIKNNIGAFEMDRSSFYNQIMSRYGVVACYLENNYKINKNLYIETGEIFKKKNRELSQVKDCSTINYQELRINKPEPTTYTIDDICRLMSRSRFLVRPPYQREEVINRKKSPYPKTHNPKKHSLLFLISNHQRNHI